MLFEYICKGWKVEYLKLENYKPGRKAHEEILKRFNDPYGNVLVLLLNFKSVNPLLSLTGANKLILMDSQWDFR